MGFGRVSSFLFYLFPTLIEMIRYHQVHNIYLCSWLPFQRCYIIAKTINQPETHQTNIITLYQKSEVNLIAAAPN